MTPKTEQRDFDVAIPSEDGQSVARLMTIRIPMEWDETINEWLMTAEGLKTVEMTKARESGNPELFRKAEAIHGPA